MKSALLFLVLATICQYSSTPFASPLPTLDSATLNRTTFVLEPTAKDTKTFSSKLAYKMPDTQTLHQAIEVANALSDTLLGNAFPLGYSYKGRNVQPVVKNDSEVFIVVFTDIQEKSMKRESLDELTKNTYLSKLESSIRYQEVLTASLDNSYQF